MVNATHDKVTAKHQTSEKKRCSHDCLQYDFDSRPREGVARRHWNPVHLTRIRTGVAAIKLLSGIVVHDDYSSEQSAFALLINFYFDPFFRHSHRATLPPLPDGKRDHSRRGWNQLANLSRRVRGTARRVRFRKIFSAQSAGRFGFAECGNSDCRRPESFRTFP